MTLNSLYPMWPELIIAISAMALLMVGVLRPETDDNGERIGWVAILALIVAAVVVVQQPAGSTAMLFDNAFVIDGFGRFMKLLVLAGSATALLLSFDD